MTTLPLLVRKAVAGVRQGECSDRDGIVRDETRETSKAKDRVERRGQGRTGRERGVDKMRQKEIDQGGKTDGGSVGEACGRERPNRTGQRDREGKTRWNKVEQVL